MLRPPKVNDHLLGLGAQHEAVLSAPVTSDICLALVPVFL